MPFPFRWPWVAIQRCGTLAVPAGSPQLLHWVGSWGVYLLHSRKSSYKNKNWKSCVSQMCLFLSCDFSLEGMFTLHLVSSTFERLLRIQGTRLLAVIMLGVSWSLIWFLKMLPPTLNLKYLLDYSDLLAWYTLYLIESNRHTDGLSRH